MHVAMCLGGSCPAAPSEISLLLFLFQLLLCVFIPPLIFPVIKFKGDSDQDGIENLQEKVGTITLHDLWQRPSIGSDTKIYDNNIDYWFVFCVFY